MIPQVFEATRPFMRGAHEVWRNDVLIWTPSVIIHRRKIGGVVERTELPPHFTPFLLEHHPDALSYLAAAPLPAAEMYRLAVGSDLPQPPRPSAAHSPALRLVR
jgi:hypothetical protein